MLALLSAPLGAAADEESLDYARPGMYAVLSGVGGVDLDRSSGSIPADGLGGFDVRLGWRESERLAYELEVEWMIAPGGISNGTWTYGANAKFFFLEDAIQPFVIIGAGGMTAARSNEVSETDWGFRGGAGVDVYLTKKIALTAEADYLFGVGKVWERDYTSFSVGLMYRF